MNKIMIIVFIFSLLLRGCADEVTVQVEHNTVTENQSTQLNCKSMNRSSSSLNYRWSKSGKTIAYLHNRKWNVVEDFKRHAEIDEEGNLVLEDIPRQYAGTYTCEVEDFAKNSVSRNQVHLTVIYLDAPKIALPRSVTEGDNFNISCYGGDAFPDSSLRIFKDQQPIAFPNVDTPYYTISNATYLNTGVYYCKACNEAGCKYSDKISLNVHFCVVTNFTLEQGKLNCSAAGHPEPNTTIILNGNVMDSGSNISTYLQEVNCNVTAECVAENAYSRDTKSLDIQACNGPNDQPANDSAHSVNMVVVAVIITILLIILIIFGVILWLRRQHCKGGSQKKSMYGDVDFSSLFSWMYSKHINKIMISKI